MEFVHKYPRFLYSGSIVDLCDSISIFLEYNSFLCDILWCKVFLLSKVKYSSGIGKETKNGSEISSTYGKLFGEGNSGTGTYFLD